MLSREMLYYLLTDEHNPAWKWIPNNGEALKLADFLAKSYRNVPLDNGCYMELFSVKDGTRYNLKTINMADASQKLVAGLMDGMQKLWEE